MNCNQFTTARETKFQALASGLYSLTVLAETAGASDIALQLAQIQLIAKRREFGVSDDGR